VTRNIRLPVMAIKEERRDDKKSVQGRIADPNPGTGVLSPWIRLRDYFIPNPRYDTILCEIIFRTLR
jgi:hypothetical protein